VTSTGQLPGMDEARRIRHEYARREHAIPKDRYALHRVANLFAHQQKARYMLRLLHREQLLPLDDKTLLDVGCGDGQQLLEWVSWGGRRAQLAGIDLIETRIARAAERLGSRSENGDTAPDLRLGDASHLPWPDGAFDIVHQSTVFTSILDPAVKRQVAGELLRVLRPGGVLIWYDFLYNNPSNPHVKGVGARELRSLFPACGIRLQRVTLAPPLARRLVPLSWVGSLMCEKLTLFNTHYLATIRKGDQ